MSIERVINYIDAVNSLALGKYKMCSENGEVEWKDDATDLPSESEIQAEVIRLQAEFTALAYARNRASAYASVGDQLDMMMKDKRDGTTTHQTACEAVKTQFPKG
jgi:hypothetical protein